VAVARLLRGPACFAKALGLATRHTGLDLVRGPLWISSASPERSRFAIARTPRVGIRVGVERRWRFVLRGHPSVSRPPVASRGRDATAPR
jgi:3-methyladenine DNA glycosylase Mpg